MTESPRDALAHPRQRRLGFAAVRLAVAAGLVFAMLSRAPATAKAAAAGFEIVLPAAGRTAPITGRIFLAIAKSDNREPRLESGASLFALGLKEARPGQIVLLDGATPGAPERTLADLAPGDYFVQAVLDLYSEFRRADGRVIWAHMDQWEGQHFTISPGNFISKPQKFRVGADAPRGRIDVDRMIPPLIDPPDTEWVQRLKFESPRLTRFWGRPMFIGATVLLPRGYRDEPGRRYPVIYLQGHFERGAPFGFTTTPDPDGKKSWARQREEAVARNLPPPTPPPGAKLKGQFSNLENGYEFFESWNADDFPRMIVVTFQHPTPFFDDSYGINSDTCGPYGDAIMDELIPAVESRFRIIREPTARILTGSSTGGWGSLALQLYHPDFFGGTWAFSPDPVDFRLYYGGVNLYEDDNAFIEKPGRDFKGGGESNRAGSQHAAILGTQDGRFEWSKHTRPGPDGYPLPVWNLATGQIDRTVVRHMRERGYDLREFLARNWKAIGPKLEGKLHVFASDTDKFYSHLAVRLLEEFMRQTQQPHVEGFFQYGPPGTTHGWRPTTNANLVRTISAYIAARRSNRN